MSDEIDKSHLVREMNQHFGTALQLISESSATNNAKIREEIKEFFVKAEEIEKEIAKKEVSSIGYVKKCELEEIIKQKQNVLTFIDKFDDQIGEIEASLRQCIREHSTHLQC